MTAKILLFDVETAPAISYHWGRWDQNIGSSQVIQESYMLCWAAKWLDSEEVYWDALPEHTKTYKKDSTNDVEIIKTLTELMDEADIVIAHNGDHFDMKWLRKQLARHELPNVRVQKTIDTLKIAKRYFNFPSNRLAELANYLGIDESKLDTDFSLWRKCMEGDDNAWRYMVDYNIQDLMPLEAVYLRLRPFMASHPNVAIYDETELACNVCGSDNLRKDGFYLTNTSKYQRYSCNDCGNRRIRGRINLLSPETNLNLLPGGA